MKTWMVLAAAGMIGFWLTGRTQAEEALGAGVKVEPTEEKAVKGQKAKLNAQPLKSYQGGVGLLGRNLGAITAVYGSLKPGSVVVRAGDRQLTEGEDFVVDYPWGRLGMGPKPTVKPGDEVEIDFVYRLRRLDSLVKNADGSQAVVKGQADLCCPLVPELAAGQTRLANLFVDYDCDGTAPDIYPITATAAEAQTQSTTGRIPRTLQKIKSGQPVKIVCWGDSVTAGGDATKGNRYAEVFERMLKEKFPAANLTVTVVAIGGSSSIQWLDPEKHPFNGKTDVCRWEKVVAEKPDLVTLEFVNDAWLSGAQFTAQYEEILKRVQGLGAEFILITPHYTMPGMMKFKSLREPESRQYVKDLKAFAGAKQLGLADASARWEHLAAEGVPYVVYLRNSINHPDDRGHRLFAEELLKNFAE